MRADAKIFASLLCCALTACTGNLNQADGPVGCGEWSALQSSMPTALPAPEGVSIGADGSRDWNQVIVAAPVRQVQVNPTYHYLWRIDRTEARDMGAYPSTATVLETSGASDETRAEGLLMPLNVACDAVMLPYRMFMLPPDTVLVGARASYRVQPPKAKS
ncbi:MAG: hypothetical protein EXS10_08750 [Phycisphaerales bacterium]|nr:hypothetical protein [Phycisphaerales bacterium]